MAASLAGNEPHREAGWEQILRTRDCRNESNRVMSSIAFCFEVSLIGAIAYAVAVWKSGSLPRVAGILVAAGPDVDGDVVSDVLGEGSTLRVVTVSTWSRVIPIGHSPKRSGFASY